MNRAKAVITFVLAAAGLSLLALSFARLFPMIEIARAISQDGALSETFASGLVHSQWTLAICLIAVAAVWHVGAGPLARTLNRVEALPSRVFFGAIGGLAFATALVLQQGLFDGIPHVTDATSHWFQARIFASGHVYAAVPPCPDHFFQHHVVMTADGKWFTKYTPGHALLLAMGMALRLPWVVMPFITALGAIAMAWLARRFFGEAVGRSSGALFILSPLALLLGASYMSHMSSLVFSMLSLCCVTAAVDKKMAGRPFACAAAAAGFCAGWSALIRPQEFAMLAPVALGAFCLVPRETRRAIPGVLVPLIAGALPFAAVLLAWNRILYGQGLAIGYGFTPAAFIQPPFQGHFGFDGTFTPTRAVYQAMWALAHFNRAMLGWPFSLLFVPLAFAGTGQKKIDALCLVAALIPPAIYFFYNYIGLEYEARYYALALPFLLVLTARGMARCSGLLARRLGPEAPAAVLCVALVFTLHAFADYWPRRLVPAYGLSYEQATPLVHRLATEQRLENAVVLIDSTGDNEFRFSSGFIFNDPRLEGSVVYARDLPAENDCVVKSFARRTVYRFVPDATWTDGRFEPVPTPVLERFQK